MKLKKFLVPVDGSDYSMRAANYALEGLLLGSCTQRVLNTAPCPVLVIR